MAKQQLTAKDRAQIRTLERLSQEAAANLIGVTPRALRYMTEAPRNSDGTYNAQALVLWMLLRKHRGELLDRARVGDGAKPKI